MAANRSVWSDVPGLVRPLITAGIVAAGITAMALFAPALDRRGYPGALFAVLILAILMLLSIKVVLGEFPPRGRRRMLADLARREGRRFRIRPWLPRSMRNRRFTVKGPDERFATAFCDARMMEWLLQHGDGYAFEVVGDRLCARAGG